MRDIENEGIRVRSNQTCLLCGHKDNIREYSKLRDRLFKAPGEWNLLRCPICALVWLDPIPVSNEIVIFYDEYITHGIPKNPSSFRKFFKKILLSMICGYSDRKISKTEKALGKLLSLIQPIREYVRGSVLWLNASQKGRLLDVGCGNGKFLANMRELGWKVNGVELDPLAVNIAKKHYEIEAFQGTLEEAKFENEYFDAVTINHVIEHISNPTKLLTECHRILKKGGVLIIVTPNIKSLGHMIFREMWRGIEAPRHLYIFSPRALQILSDQLGFKILKLGTTARSARWMWKTSHLIKEHGFLQESDISILSRSERLKAVFFHIVEYLFCLFNNDVGEEIVFIASK